MAEQLEELKDRLGELSTAMDELLSRERSREPEPGEQKKDPGSVS